MDEQLKAIIDRAIDAGLDDEDIASLVEEHKTRQSTQPVQQQPPVSKQQQSHDRTVMRGMSHGMLEPSTPEFDPLDLGGAMRNAPSSAMNLVKNAPAAALNALYYGSPFATTIDRALMGDAVVQSLGQRYGGVENIKRTVHDDPVGTAADAAAVVGVGRAGFRAGGEAVATAARNPLVKTAAKIGTKLAIPGMSKLSAMGDVIDVLRGSQETPRVAPPSLSPEAQLGLASPDAVAARQAVAVDGPSRSALDLGRVRGGDPMVQPQPSHTPAPAAKPIDVAAGMRASVTPEYAANLDASNRMVRGMAAPSSPTPESMNVGALGDSSRVADLAAGRRMVSGMSTDPRVPSTDSMNVGALGDSARVADLAASRSMIEKLAQQVEPQASHANTASKTATTPTDIDYLRQDVVSTKANQRKGLHMAGESTPHIIAQLMEILKQQALTPEAQALRTAASQRLRVSGVIPKAGK